MESEKSLGVDGEHRTADTVALEELEVAGLRGAGAGPSVASEVWGDGGNACQGRRKTPLGCTRTRGRGSGTWLVGTFLFLSSARRPAAFQEV